MYMYIVIMNVHVRKMYVLHLYTLTFRTYTYVRTCICTEFLPDILAKGGQSGVLRMLEGAV